METRLSRQLQNFYHPSGNRFLFVNGMTLNELALAIWEGLDYTGVDPGVVSKVLSGKRLFTRRQLRVFCQILRLDAGERKRLEEALLEDLVVRSGFSENFFVKKKAVFVELARLSLGLIRRLIDAEQLDLSLDWTDQAIDLIQDEANTVTESGLRRHLLKIYGELLTGKVFLLQVTRPQRVSSRAALEIARQLIRAGQEADDPSLIGEGYFTIGDTNYIGGRYSSAVEAHLAGFDLPLLGGYSEKLHRSLALSFAYLNKETEFDRIKSHLFSQFPVLSLSSQLATLEGITRGEALLGRGASFERTRKRLYETQRQIVAPESNQLETLRRIQLIRTDLEAALAIRSSENKSYWEKIGKEGMALAKRYGYLRHGATIDKLLSTLFYPKSTRRVV